MVEGFAIVIIRVAVVRRRNAVPDEAAVLLLEYLIGRIEGEELASILRDSPRLPNAGDFVDIKCILIDVVRRVVLRAVILVVAALGLQQTRHAHMGYLARLGGGIKQVAEGFSAPAVGEFRVTAGKNVVHDTGARRGAARIPVEILTGSLILELEAVALVDAVGSTDRQVILRIVVPEGEIVGTMWFGNGTVWSETFASARVGRKKLAVSAMARARTIAYGETGRSPRRRS